MRRFALFVVLLCFASGDVSAQGALRRHVGSMATQVKNFLAPNTEHGLRSAIGGLLLIGAVCTGWSGCSNHTYEKSPVARDASSEATRKDAEVAEAERNQSMELPWWDANIQIYKGAGVWQDSQGNKGELELSLMEQHIAGEEYTWLTVKGGENEENLAFSRVDYELYTIDQLPAPMGEASFDDEGQMTLIFNTDNSLRLKMSYEGANILSLSATLEKEDGVIMQWHAKLIEEKVKVVTTD